MSDVTRTVAPCPLPSASPAPDRHAPGLVRSYLRLLREFRRTDLVRFCEEHERLYAEARRTGDHRDVTRHYYRTMGPLIGMYYGESWHFCPPEHPGQEREEAARRMHRRVAEMLDLGPGTRALDIGCGIGGMLRELARTTGAVLRGVTLEQTEVEEAARLAERDGLEGRCVVAQGDGESIPFADGEFDAAYAVYALKYYPVLDRVMAEIHRVLRAGGRFVAYCLCKSDRFDPANPGHASLLARFEHSTAMPSLHTVPEIVDAAARAGLACAHRSDLSDGGLPWYDQWVRDPWLPWMVSSHALRVVVRLSERVHVLPRGFARFNDTFLSGTVRHLIGGGRMGILTGSALLAFERRSG